MPLTLQQQPMGLLASPSPYDYGSLGLLSQQAYNLASPQYYQPRGAVPFTLGPGASPPAGGGGGGSDIGSTLGGILLNNPSLLTNLINRLFPTQPGTPDNTAGDQALQNDVADSSAAIGADIAASLPGLLDTLNNQQPQTQQPSTSIEQLDPGAGPTYQAPPEVIPPIVAGGLLDTQAPPAGQTTITQTDPGAGPTYQTPPADVPVVVPPVQQPETPSGQTSITQTDPGVPTYQEPTPIAPVAALPGGLLDTAPAGSTEITQIDPNAGQTFQQPPASSTAPELAGLGATGAAGLLGALAPAGTVTISEGAAAAEAAAQAAAASSGVTAGTAAAGGGSAAGSVVAAVAPYLAAAGLLYAGIGPMFDSHSVTLGQPLEGQSTIQLQSGQAALREGNAAYGGGNDASQGSGNWFYIQPDGTPYWIGADATQDINASLNAMRNNPSAWDQRTLQGRIWLPSVKDRLQKTYDSTGGSANWGVDFIPWVNQLARVYGNATGTPN